MDKNGEFIKTHPRIMWLVWPLWLVAGYYAAGFLVSFAVQAVSFVFGQPDLLQTNMGSLLAQILIYLTVAALVLGVPLKKKLISKRSLGVGRRLGWKDIGYGVAGYVVYFVTAIVVIVTITYLIEDFNLEQAQKLGVGFLLGADYVVAFLLFVVVAPLIEELLMRGFLYGKLRDSRMPAWPAAVLVSVLFALAHGQWNVGVDTFVLSMVACRLRETTGAVWPGVVVHAIKNLIAFLMLFVFTATY